jgi:hypothetical protein
LRQAHESRHFDESVHARLLHRCARALTDVRSAVGSQPSYVDGLWTYPLPWAVSLLKTGDTAFVRENFATPGPSGSAAEPSIEDAAHAIAADRTGPMGTMEATQDIDTEGSWTVDYEALLGLAAYRSIATRLGEDSEATWASQEYASLLAATNTVIAQTIAENHLDYLPCSLVQPNTADRCSNPMDANWTSHAWGIAAPNKVLLDSLVSQDPSGSLVVGRGVRPAWLATGVRSRWPTSPRAEDGASAHDRRLGQARHPDPARHGVGSRALRSSLVRPQRGRDHQGHRAPVGWSRHDCAECALRDGHAAKAADLTGRRGTGVMWGSGGG